MNKPLKALYLSERPLSRNEAHMCVEQPVVDRVLLQQEMESFGFTLYAPLEGEPCMKSNCEKCI